MAAVTPTHFTVADIESALGVNAGDKVAYNYTNLRDLFKALLVTSAGSKPALGWTIQFPEDTDAIVFRSPDDTYSIGVRQGSGTGTTYDGWVDVVYSQDFTDNYTATSQFHGCCIPDSYPYHAQAVGYGDNIYIMFATDLDTAYTTRISSPQYQIMLMSGYYNSFHGDLKPLFAVGGISNRIDLGGGVYENVPLYSANNNYTSAINFAVAITNNLQPNSISGISVPNTQDGSPFPTTPAWLNLFTHGVQTGYTYNLTQQSIDNNQYVFTPLLKRIYDSSDEDISVVDQQIFLGSLRGVDMTFNNYHGSVAINTFTTINTYNGRQYLWFRTRYAPLLVRIDAWDI